MGIMWLLLAAPVVTVRGHTQIEVTSLEQQPESLMVRGELRDAELFSSLDGRVIEGRLGESLAQTRTAAGGVFAMAFRSPMAATELVLRFPGDDGYVDAKTARPIAAAPRMTATLRVNAPGEVNLQKDSLKFAISVQVGSQDVSLPMVLLDGRGRELARANAPAQIALSGEKLGDPGLARFTARFSGDDHVAPTEASVDVLLVTSASVTLKSEKVWVSRNEPLTLEGQVQDASGPVAGESVAVFVQGVVTTVTRTDEAGHFSVDLQTDDLTAGRIELYARTQPHVPWRAVATSLPLHVEVLAQPARDRRWLVLITVGTLLSLLAIRRRSSVARPAGIPSQKPRLLQSGALERYRDLVQPYVGAAWNFRTPAEVAQEVPKLAPFCEAFAAVYFGPGPKEWK